MRSFETKLQFAVFTTIGRRQGGFSPTRTHGIYTSRLIFTEGLNLFYIHLEFYNHYLYG